MAKQTLADVLYLPAEHSRRVFGCCLLLIVQPICEEGLKPHRTCLYANAVSFRLLHLLLGVTYGMFPCE